MSLKNLFYFYLIKKSGYFDRAYYLLNNPDVRKADTDAIMHYIRKGGVEGRNPSPKFNSQGYLELYQDVKTTGVNPLVHFLRHGKKENRYPNLEITSSDIGFEQHLREINRLKEQITKINPSFFIKGKVDFDPGAETVIIVSHDLSLTGAPILSWNIAKRLREKYNTICISLRDGPLLNAFLQETALVVCPYKTNAIFNSLLAEKIIDKISKKYPIKFAIVNSIVSFEFLPSLAKNFIPSINLIHEFAAYTRPITAFPTAALWAHALVFSTAMTYDNALDLHPEFNNCNIKILPQGKCDTPDPSITEETGLVYDDEALLEIIKDFKNPKKPILVLGIGNVQIRKGVDLFLTCAQKIINKYPGKVKFIWIGDGYDPERDLNYSIYLSEQIDRAGINDSVYFIKSISNIEVAYDNADFLLISSRLDPLPNVAIDAMIHKIPLVCFENGTGIANILKEFGLGNECVAEYMNVEIMSKKLIAMIESETLRNNVAEKLFQIAKTVFDFDDYLSKLEGLTRKLEIQVEQEIIDIQTIKQSGLARLDYYLRPDISVSNPFLYYVRSWASGVFRRKLFPGFHPGRYLEAHPEIKDKEDPLANYIRNNKPQGPWAYEVITNNDKIENTQDEARIALHLHVFYPEIMPEIVSRLNFNNLRPHLFISVPSISVKDQIDDILKTYSGKIERISIVPNRGRDIGALLTEFSQPLLNDYDIIGHLHTKKSVLLDSKFVHNWKSFLYENLLGGKHKMADIIINKMTINPSIGLVFPDDPYIIDWGENKPYANQLCELLNIKHISDHFSFPIGTMFWARTKALEPLFKMNLKFEDFPEEPLPYDGSILHAIERLLPYVTSSMGYENHVTYVEGLTR